MFEIHTGLRKRPSIVLLYGLPGVGKSELASCSGRALFLDIELGVDYLNVASVKPKNFDELRQGFLWASKQVEYDTIVIDSWSAAERMTLAHTLKTHQLKSLSQLAHGAAYGHNRESLKRLVKGIEFLRDAGKNVIVTAHATIKTVEDPTMASYDRIEFECDKALVNPLVSICDGCFYFRPMVRTIENKDKDIKVISSGAKELLLADKGGAMAKSRFSHMPDTVEFAYERDGSKKTANYKEFWERIAAGPTEIVPR